ncbi:hypothetical protein N8I77_002197 [Diaporthe amygdali]|uniref:Prolyl 4-hydroxylase alpha subunit domain-containing protein n=1 Tax=Phomopsis amygdali TaxID=1214568 RepID=A0AAD9SQG6_PHOAM|nr:hypothetical protein N8I77_002197 [Diaporthe amygdali]
MKPTMKPSSLAGLRMTASLLAVIAAIGVGYFSKQKYFRIDENIETYRCPKKIFAPIILSTDPVLIYIDEFVTPFEAEYLISLANFEPSTIGLTDQLTNTTIRRSHSAILPDVVDKNVSNPVIECILQRASAFQGYVPMVHTEPLQLVRYQAGEYYHEHYDAWKGNDPDTQGNRDTSFFVILRSEGLLDSEDQGRQITPPLGARASAGTSFPRLRRRFADEKLCEVIECGEGVEGIVAKPIARSALFWTNLFENGTVHPGSLHQGLDLPPGKGEKIGMNIWTWNRPYIM